MDLNTLNICVCVFNGMHCVLVKNKCCKEFGGLGIEDSIIYQTKVKKQLSA